MDIRLIQRPSDATLEILKTRSKLNFENYKPGAVGLIQGKIIEMMVASDIAYKASGVMVSDVRGSCPQNFVLLAIVGEAEEVRVALESIKAKSEEMKI